MEPSKLLREVMRLYAQMQRTDAGCDDGTSTVQCHVLTELVRNEGITQKVLVDRLGLDKSWISRAVDSLVADGKVLKEPSQVDRRSVTLRLTPSGREHAHALECRLNAHAGRLLEHISPDRHPQICESLNLLLSALQITPAKHPKLACGVPQWRNANDEDWGVVRHLLSASGLPIAGAREHLEHFIVGDIDGEVACVGGVELYGEYALLRSVVVATGARGNGWGKMLIDQMIQRCQRLGVRHAYLLTTNAEAFFFRHGFTAIDRDDVPQAVLRSVEFQGACPTNAIVMRRELSCSSLY